MFRQKIHSALSGPINGFKFAVLSISTVIGLYGLMYLVSQLAATQIESSGLSQPPVVPLVIAFSIMVFLLLVMIGLVINFCIRRLKDLNHSPWLSILIIVLGINVLFFFYLIFATSKSSNMPLELSTE